MAAITILTPTYNRKNTLPRLYESLCGQTFTDFEWLIVDDGSTDGTAELAEAWRRESPFVRYVRKGNGGKHTALNAGIALVDSELTFIVDSDDYLPEDALRTILDYHQKYRSLRERERLCGYSFLRFYSNGKVNTAYFPEEDKIDTYVRVRINGGIGGDKAEVFYTDILRQFPFPVFGEEKFLPEDLIWVRMSGPYRMVHINRCVYISDYLEGGLTKSGRRMKLKSPCGMLARSMVYLEDEQVGWKTKVKMTLLGIVYGHFAGVRGVSPRCGRAVRLLHLLLYLPGSAVYLWWRKKYGDRRTG